MWENLKSDFDKALIVLAKALYIDLPVGVQPEDQLKPPVKAVLEALGTQVIRCRRP